MRQTKQCHPKQFEHAGRGMWKLKRSAEEKVGEVLSGAGGAVPVGKNR